MEEDIAAAVVKSNDHDTAAVSFDSLKGCCSL